MTAYVPTLANGRRGRLPGVMLAAMALLFLPGAVSVAHAQTDVSPAVNRVISQGGGQSLNVIVEVPQSTVDQLAASYGVKVVKRLASGAVLSGTGTQLAQIANANVVDSLTEDGVLHATMDIVTQSTGASQEWAGPCPPPNQKSTCPFAGLTGLGVGVAVIDSGVDAIPDVANPNDQMGGDDQYGHGTHIASIIAGSGNGSAYIGMAPGASIIDLRVLGADGSGYVSDAISAIDWAIANASKYNIRVLNLSFGYPTIVAWEDDPLARAVERAVRSGLVVVTAAGNLGTADGTPTGQPVMGGIGSPGSAPDAVTVGALDTHRTVTRSDDTVAWFSSRGPAGDPDDPSTWILKPDLVAPGVSIYAGESTSTYLYQYVVSHEPKYGTPVDCPVTTQAGCSHYLPLSGTSMATAVVSGAAALVLQAQPSLTPGEVRAAGVGAVPAQLQPHRSGCRQPQRAVGGDDCDEPDGTDEERVDGSDLRPGDRNDRDHPGIGPGVRERRAEREQPSGAAGEVRKAGRCKHARVGQHPGLG
jgi:serine protease AprX